MLPTPPPLPATAPSLDWGSLPDWLAAVGTILAVGISIYLALRDGKRLSVERQEAAEDRAEFRRAQAQEAEQRTRRLASQVTLVTERVFIPLGPEFREYQVHNGGDEPIALVSIVERHMVDGALSPERHVVKTWPIIEAGGHRKVEGEKYSQNETVPVVHPIHRSIIFRDGLGQLWLRNELGSLRRLSEDDPDTPKMVLLSP